MARPQPNQQQQQPGQQVQAGQDRRPGIIQAMRDGVQALRDGPVGQAIDKAIDTADQALGTTGKAWLANGLDELRQAVAHGSEQVQAGNNPGLYGTITTGEATAERMEGKDRQAPASSFDVPGKMSLADLRQHAADRAKEAEKEMGKDGPDKGREHDGPEM